MALVTVLFCHGVVLHEDQELIEVYGAAVVDVSAHSWSKLVNQLPVGI